MPKVSTLEVIEPEPAAAGRRKRSGGSCRRVSAPRVVSATARRHRLATSQLYNWRQNYCDSALN